MKKILFFMLFLPMMAVAQNDVITEVGGIKFGTAYNVAKSQLEASLGKADDEAKLQTGRLISYFDVKWAGITFDDAHFVFKPKGNADVLNKVFFTYFCQSRQDARVIRDKIASEMKKTYSLQSDDDGKGDIQYGGGTSPVDKNDFGFYISIQKGKLERFPYEVVLEYGPY